MIEMELLKEILSSGADLSTILIVVWMFRQDKRILFLELKTGIRKLVGG